MFNDKASTNGNKLRMYRLHKDRNTTELYVSSSMNRYERSILSRLRTGSLPLEVETGMYNNVPLENRLCKQCQVCVEDEIHFTVDCPFYDDLRYTLFTLLRDEYSGLMTDPQL